MKQLMKIYESLTESKIPVRYADDVELDEDLINESEAVSFNRKIVSNQYIYDFIVDDVDMLCTVYPNPWKKHYYDFAFITKGGSTKDRVGRNLTFMNSVLKTVANCVIDFIDDTDIVKIIAFEGDRIREAAWTRFFKNHSYFSKFEIDDSHTKSGFVEIHVNKRLDTK